MFLTLLIILLTVGGILLLLFCVIFEVKIDVTKERELLLWYTEYDEKGEKVRRFLKLLTF